MFSQGLFWRKPLFISCCLLSICLSANAQATFGNTTNTPGGQAFVSKLNVGVADVDFNGYDDLIIVASGQFLFFCYQSAEGNFDCELAGQVSQSGTWTLTAGDVDNDGRLEIMTGGYYDGLKITRWSTADSAWQSWTLPQSDIFVQGSNFADMDADGWLDAFACHDDAASRIWRNAGNGVFVPAFDWIDFSTDPPSDNSGNYGSVWTDFDTDGDLDLYIAKCRHGVNDPADPRRVNVLYEQEADGSFTERAAAYGLDIGRQSWAAEFQDIDNDGDFDALITNHDTYSQLLENRGGWFVDISEQAGFNETGDFLQGIMRDMDNDGFVDILLARLGRYYHNNGDKTFTLVNIPGFDMVESLSTGDLNHDGFLDLYTSLVYPQTDRLWFNDGNDNHWLTFTLEGTVSNRRGTGALIELHGPWGVQVRELRSGESYGITTSLQVHFGLGADTLADYAVVRWPSGIIDVLSDLAADQFVHVVEGTTCQADTLALSVEGTYDFCPGDTLPLWVAVPTGSMVVWNDGFRGTYRLLTEPGTWRAVVMWPNGCVSSTGVLKLRRPVVQAPHIAVQGFGPWCVGDTVWLEAAGAAGPVSWSSGDTTTAIAATHAGPWVLYYDNTCETVAADTVWLDFIEAPPPAVWPDTVETGQTAALVAQGDSVVWYAHPDSLVPIAAGDTLFLPQADSSRTFWAANLTVTGGGTYHTGMAEHAGLPYGGNIYNGGIIFDCYRPFVLHSVRVFTDTPGPRIIELQDETGTVVASRAVDVQSADTVLVLDLPVAPGQNWLLTTNEASNLEHFGFQSPRFQRSDQNVMYPYVVPNVLSIHDSPYGAAFYYYFYDWEVEVPPLVCESERVPVELFVWPPVAVEEVPAQELPALDVWPNPAEAVVHVRLPCLFAFRQMTPGQVPVLRVYDVTGRRMMEVPATQCAEWQLDVSHLPKGIYLLEVVLDGRLLQARLAVP